ncbi:hypothetical protein KDA11_05495 [Candidatus Saccharibacteria bacterium]|nr:hypothetical protein [Candidatus Saccharibacteria bacterium]MCA9348431.1 hypothetical protein [Candidatus Saccharibacteria bacterium]
MNNKNYPNLRSWKKGQSGNPNGRKQGSKNVSTIVRKLLEQNAVDEILLTTNLTDLAKGQPTSYAQAMVLAMIKKALEGDVRAVKWLADRQDKSYIADDQTSFFNRPELVIKVVKSGDQQ